MQPGMPQACELLTACYHNLLLLFVLCASNLLTMMPEPANKISSAWPSRKHPA